MLSRLLPAALLATCAASASATPIVVGYWLGGEPSGSAPRTDGLTLANYAFAVPSADGSIPDLDADGAASLRSLTESARSSGAKILLSIGGWSGSAGFSGAAAAEESRARFAAAAAALTAKYALDGVDVDWEYPDQEGAGNPHRPEDRANFALLLKAVREALDARAAANGRPHPLLTAATGADAEYLPHVDLRAALAYLDYVNLMAYDIYNGADSVAGHQANLRRAAGQDPERPSVEESVDAYLAAGVPAAKLVLGFPFYGRVWRGVAAGPADGLYGTARTKGEIVGYDELVDRYIGKRGFVRLRDERAQAAYLWNPATRDFVSYGDPEAAALAARFAASRGLAGVMFWELGGASRHRELLDALTRVPAAAPRP